MLKRRRLEPENLLSVWDATQQIPVDLRSVNIREALKIASQFNIYAYDAYFLVLQNSKVQKEKKSGYC